MLRLYKNDSENMNADLINYLSAQSDNKEDLEKHIKNKSPLASELKNISYIYKEIEGVKVPVD